MFIPDLDPRIVKWPFMESVNKTLLIVTLYLVFVKIIGPAWMRNRSPYELRKLILVYNFAVVLLSTWIFYKFGIHGWFGKYTWLCQPVDYSEDEDAMGMVEACWYFFISKLIELADTVFFILRKKDSQVTFLHVIHHAMVPLTTRFVISRGASGYSIFFGFANSFVHIWMYLYYALSAIGPWTQKYLWWKKYLTSLQMVQFVFVFCFMVLHMVLPGCETNGVMIMVSIGQAVFFFALFMNFYTSSYKKKHKYLKAVPSSERRAATGTDNILSKENDSDSLIKHRFQGEKLKNGSKSV